jgi:hypothetical protein
MSAIDIPSISIALSIVNSEISNASQAIIKLQDASMSLDKAILSASSVNLISRHEIAQLPTQNFSLAISEMQDKMILLQEILSRNTVIPMDLLSADEIPLAIQEAANCPEINYALAELALETFSHLWRKAMERKFAQGKEWKKKWVFPKAIWATHNFLGNIVKLLKGGDGRKIYNSIQLIMDIVDDDCPLECSCELFDTLALILLKRNTLPPENDQRNWAYLISKNQKLKVDHGILRLINTFLCSSRKQTINKISYNVLGMIRNFVGNDSLQVILYA